jgi:S-ribosylhomocysteine lyase
MRDYHEHLVPGQSAMDCGNHIDMNIPMMKYVSKKYLEVLNNIKEENLVYPK